MVIRIDKPTPTRIIVPALQIVQPRFRVVDVSTVAQGVLFAEGGGHRAGRVVGKVQLIAAPRQLHQLVAQIMVIVGRAVDGLRDALAVGIVAVGDIRPGLAHPRELAAVLPCVRPRAVAQEVADLVRRQALPADAREQVAPACVTVAIVDGAHRRAETSGRIGVTYPIFSKPPSRTCAIRHVMHSESAQNSRGIPRV